MATLEERVDKIDEKYSNLHTVVNILVAKVDALGDKIDLFVGEMRQQNAIRAEEIRALDSKLENVSSQTRSLINAAMIGIGAVVVSSLAMAAAVVYSAWK